MEAFINLLYSYDVDPSHPAEDHTFSLETAPTGMIHWTPEETQLGDHSVTVQLHDDHGLVDTQSYTLSVLVVNPDNTAPMIISGPINRATEEMPLYLSREGHRR